MKIGIFSDLHYSRVESPPNEKRKFNKSLDKLKSVLDIFDSNGVDLCICLGDMVDRSPTRRQNTECIKELMEEISKRAYPFHVVPGNHDYDDFSAETFAELTHTQVLPYYFDKDNYRFILLDACYRSNFQRFDVAGVLWLDANIPNFELDFLRSALKTDKKCIILIHECLDPNAEGRHIVKQAEAVRKILEESGNVPLVLEGHYHAGCDSVVNGIHYITMPAMVFWDDLPYKIIELN